MVWSAKRVVEEHLLTRLNHRDLAPNTESKYREPGPPDLEEGVEAGKELEPSA